LVFRGKLHVTVKQIDNNFIPEGTRGKGVAEPEGVPRAGIMRLVPK
jgi:hypothetical protein